MNTMFLTKINNQSMKTTILALFVSLCTILAPVTAFVVIMSLFVISDTALGIYATIKINGLSSFRSNKLFNLVVKTVFYMGGILLAFLLDTYIFEGTLMGIKLLLVKVVTLLFCYIELVSLNETSQLLGNKSFWILLKDLFAKGKELKQDLNQIFEDDKKEDKE